MRTLWQDIRYGVRMLARSPGLTVIAVLSLALGIGANTAIFSFVNAVLLRSLPIFEPERLVFVFSGSQTNPYSVSSYPDYVDYRDRNEVFSDVTAYSQITLSMNSEDRTEAVVGSVVTGNYFEVLGVRAARGRTFTPEEDRTPGAHPVAVIGHGLWQRRFGGDPNIVGRQLTLNGREFTVVGVTPANFNGTEAGRTSDIFVPMMMQALVRPPRSGYSGEMNPDLLAVRGAGWLDVIGRLKPGITAEQAQASMNTLASQLAQAYPETNREQLAVLSPVSKGDPEQRGTLVSVAGLLMTVVSLVLLIACANVANLLLARAASRRKEISIRLAMGAGRARVVRQLLTESLLLSLLGGAAGTLLAVWLADALQTSALAASLFPFTYDLSLDRTVLGFALLLSVLTGVVFGIAPALQASRPNLVPSLKDEAMIVVGGEARRFNLRNILVVMQVALSLVLLIGAGLFLRSLQHARSIDPGFEPERVLVMPLNINLLRYTKQQGRDFYRQVLERVEALPGVQSATLSRNPPLSGASRQSSVVIEGQDNPSLNRSSSEGQVSTPDANQNSTLADVVDLKYFKTLGIPLLRGRDFGAQDQENSPGVVIINETFAGRYFPNQDPLGRRLSFGGTQGPWLEVVGVVRDAKYLTLGELPTPFVYQSLRQRHESGMVLHVRTGGSPASYLAAVRGEVQAVEKNLPITNVRPMTELLDISLSPARMGALLLGTFGLLALLLAAIGLYGVISFLVSRRTHEIGIRLALGAQRADVLRLILREGMTLVGFGLALGLLAALIATRLLAGFLYGVSATDPVTFGGIVAILTVAALIASLIPARRAARVDPLVAIRYE